MTPFFWAGREANKKKRNKTHVAVEASPLVVPKTHAKSQFLQLLIYS